MSVVRNKSNLIQWKNTDEVLDWFKSIDDKKSFRFIQFDIVNFYPSITEDLLKDAINWAKEQTDITNEEENILLKSKMLGRIGGGTSPTSTPLFPRM